MPLQARTTLIVRLWISSLIASVPLILVFASKAALLLMVVIALSLIAVALATGANGLRGRLWHSLAKEPLLWFVLAFTAYGAVSTLWSVSPVTSLRLLAFEFLLPVALLVCVLAIDDEIMAAVDLKKCLFGFTLAAVVLIFETRSGMALRGLLGLRVWQGSLAHAGVTLGFLAPVIALFFIPRARLTALLFLGFIAVAIGLLVNDSAKLAFVIFVIGALIYADWLARLRLFLFCGFALYIAAQPWIWSSLGGDFLSTTVLGFKASSVHRLYIWETFSRLALLNPLHGYGIASGHVLFQFDAVMASLPEHLRQYVDVWHPHNNYLELWLDLGVIGIGLLLLALWHIFSGAWLTKRGSFASFLAIAAVAACSHGLWQGWWIAVICLVVMLNRITDAKDHLGQ